MTLQLIHAPPCPPRVRRPRWRAASAMKLVRRLHLYSGLALVPFVALYGVTAFLFNHPGAGSEVELRTVSRAELEEHGRQVLMPLPLELAQLVHAQAAEPGWALDPQRELRYRGRLALGARAGEVEHSLALEDPRGAATWSRRPRPAVPAAEKRTLELPTVRAALASLEVAARSLWSSEGAALSDLRVRSSPSLEFGLLVDGEARRASYDLAKGELSVHAAGEERPRSVRSFLLRLHTAHGYPAEPGARSAWAFVVDLLAAALALWAVTGVLMWWQMRLLRRAGLFSLAVGFVAALVLGERMWVLLA